MRRLVTIGRTTVAATGRCLARARRRVSVGLITGVATWWFLVGWAVVLLLPAPAATPPKARFTAVPGRTAHIQQPGMPVWVVPVDRLA